MQKLIDFDADEKAWNFAWSQGNQGGTALARMRRHFTGEEWDVIQASFLHRLGQANPGAQNAAGDAFSPNTFMTNWNKLKPEAKNALFSGKRYAGLRADLDRLADVIGSMKDSLKMANTSNTAASMIAYNQMQSVILGTAGYFGGSQVGDQGLGGAAAGILAPKAAAKLLTNPAFVKWLASAPVRENQISGKIGQLGAIWMAQPAIREELQQYFDALEHVTASSSSHQSSRRTLQTIGERLLDREPAR